MLNLPASTENVFLFLFSFEFPTLKVPGSKFEKERGVLR